MISSPTAPLLPDDLIEIVFPTKSPSSRDHLAHCLNVFKNRSIQVICHSEWAFHDEQSPYGYYAHSLEKRTAGLIQAINGPAKLLWAFTGGFGCAEIVERLEAMNFVPTSLPKLLLGYSDITHLHALWTKWGWPSLHGPNCGWTAATKLPQAPVTVNAKANLEHTLDYLLAPGKPLSYTFEWLNPDESISVYAPIMAPIYGGNATLVKEMDSTLTALPLHKSILFLEESPECPKRMNRVFTSLLRSGALDHLAGLIFGYIPDEKDLSIPEALSVFLKDHLLPSRAHFPILYSPNFGHGLTNDPLPFGVTSTLSFKKDTWHLDIPQNFGLSKT